MLQRLMRSRTGLKGQSAFLALRHGLHAHRIHDHRAAFINEAEILPMCRLEGQLCLRHCFKGYQKGAVAAAIFHMDLTCAQDRLGA
ncbi:hypothetical protein AQ1_01974 [alpha proteobacterium Q-1]|nr:hypothetical protein AQ1_01974 [alpha proteobacterium Q-1]